MLFMDQLRKFQLNSEKQQQLKMKKHCCFDKEKKCIQTGVMYTFGDGQSNKNSFHENNRKKSSLSCYFLFVLLTTVNINGFDMALSNWLGRKKSPK